KPDLKCAKGDRLYVKLQLNDWNNLDAEISDVVACVRAQKTPTAPFEFLAMSSSPEDQLICTKQCLADQPSLPALWRGEKTPMTAFASAISRPTSAITRSAGSPSACWKRTTNRVSRQLRSHPGRMTARSCGGGQNRQSMISLTCETAATPMSPRSFAG